MSNPVVAFITSSVILLVLVITPTFMRADTASDLLKLLNSNQSTAAAVKATSTVVTPHDEAQIMALKALVVELTKRLAQLLANANPSQSPEVSVPATSSTIIFTRNLSRGARGEDVRTLQLFLVEQGVLQTDATTGFFGSLTELAVKNWQKKNNIVSGGSPATTGYGVVGPKTIAKIMSLSRVGSGESLPLAPGAGATTTPNTGLPGGSGGGEGAGSTKPPTVTPPPAPSPTPNPNPVPAPVEGPIKFLKQSLSRPNRGPGSTASGSVSPTPIPELTIARVDYTKAISAIDYGADPTGATDSTTPINSMFADCALDRIPVAYFPAGIYKVSSSLDTKGCTTIVGDGAGSTAISMRSVTEPTLIVRTAKSSKTNAKGLILGGLTLFRHGVPKPGATGLDMREPQWGAPYVFDMSSGNNYDGMIFGSTENGFAELIGSHQNGHDGIVQTNSGQSANSKWRFVNVVTDQNSGWGVRVVSSIHGQTMHVASWDELKTFGNGEGGIVFLGDSSKPIGGSIAIRDSVFGEDGDDEIRLVTYSPPSSSILIKDTYVEIPGTHATGPTYNVPASGRGAGIHAYGKNDARLIIENVTVNGAQTHGIALLNVGHVELVSNAVSNNGLSQVNKYSGLYLGDFDSVSVIGGSYVNIGLPPGSYQQYAGVFSTTGSNLSLKNVDVFANTKPVFMVNNANAAQVINVIGYQP